MDWEVDSLALSEPSEDEKDLEVEPWLGSPFSWCSQGFRYAGEH